MTRRLEDELDKLSAVADLPREKALLELRKALTHSSNLIVARAAKLAVSFDLRELAADMAVAFARFMPPHDFVKLDPQCWAKNELAKALAAFEAQLPLLFADGMKHRQLEPSWGGVEDSAGPLRGTCALALVQCRDVPSSDLLRLLTPLFTDKEVTVQMNAVRAIEQLGTDSSALLLRFRAELGSAEPEVLGACIGGVLRLEGHKALAWTASFIQSLDETSTEAAFALSEHRTPEAFEQLRIAYDRAADRIQHLELRETLLTAVAAMRLPVSTEWLLEKASADALDARSAANTLWSAEPSDEVATKLRELGYAKPPQA
jgi:hypothetical protein